MFSSDVKVKIAKPLYERLAEIASAGGYSSTDEFIVHILEKETAKFAVATDDEEVKSQLRGLGYIE
jgi:rRNA-processing protein FCF1